MTNPMKAIAGPNGTTYVEMTDEEAADFNAMQAAALAAQPRENILNEIAALELTVTQRRIREAATGTDGGWLLSLNNQIATLRSQL